MYCLYSLAKICSLMRSLYLTLLLLLSIPLAGFSNIRLPAIISSHMVLQQKSEITMWGWSSPGEPISVVVDWDTTVYKTAGTAGAKWSIKIKTPEAGGPHKIELR